jgi:galactose-1-phosphate uridylyltransferase
MESDNEKMDVHSYVINLASKVMQEWQDECIRDVDTSQLNVQEIKRMITSISRCEFELDILLTLTEEIGGFGSSYPRKCLESLKLFKTILEMELKGEGFYNESRHQ